MPSEVPKADENVQERAQKFLFTQKSGPLMKVECRKNQDRSKEIVEKTMIDLMNMVMMIINTQTTICVDTRKNDIVLQLFKRK